MYNYAQRFFIPDAAGCSFEDLERALRSFFERRSGAGENPVIVGGRNSVELEAHGWKLRVTLNRQFRYSARESDLAFQFGDQRLRERILACREVWDLVTDPDRQDRFYNYFQHTCDVIRTLCPEALAYDLASGEVDLPEDSQGLGFEQ